MAWSLVASTKAETYSAATTLDAEATLNLAVKDRLCIATGWTGGDSTCAVATTAPADSFTMCTQIAQGTNRFVLGYVEVGTANASATIRVTLGTARGNFYFTVFQFRPDAGDTVTLAAGPSPGQSNTGGTAQSGNISPNGGDILVFAGAYNASGLSFSSEQIGDSAAAAALDANRLSGWYQLYTSNQTDIHAQATFADTDQWMCDIIAFESSSGGATESLAATVTAVSSLTPFIFIRKGVSSSVTSASSPSGDLIRRFNFGATVSSLSSVSGMAWIRKAFSNTIQAISTVTGNLSGGIVAAGSRLRIYMRGVLRKGIR